MQPSIKKTILIILLVIVCGTAIWYFFFHYDEQVAFEEICQEFDKNRLTFEERKLLNEWFDFQSRNDRKQATTLIINNHFQFRDIFEKVLQRGLFFRLINKPDSAAIKINIAEQIADVFENHFNERFLKREFGFCCMLNGRELYTKFEIDFFYNKGYHLLYDLGQDSLYPLARECYQKSLHLTKKIGDDKREVENLLNIQYFLYHEGYHEQALHLGMKIIDKLRQIGYRYREGWALYNNANILLELGEYRKALNNLEAGLEIAKQLDYQKCEMKILERMMIAHRRLGGISKIQHVKVEILKLYRKMGKPDDEVRFLISNGLSNKTIGNYSEAEENFKQAYALAREIKDPNEAIALLNLGELSRILGVYENALQYNFQALELNCASENYYDIALTQKEIGDVYKDQGYYTEALNYYNQAIKTIEKGTRLLTPQTLESEIWLSIGDLHRKNNYWQQAQDAYLKALSTFTKNGYQEGMVHALTRLGNVSQENKNFEQSLRYLDDAVAIASTLKDPLLLSNAYYSLGLVHNSDGKFDSAEEEFRKAIELVEMTREKIQGDEKINYFSTIHDFYEDMILLQCDRANNEIAFNYSERSRSRAFLDLFQGETTTILSSMSNNGNLQPTLQELQNTLDESTQLVEYKVTKNKILIFVIDQHQLKVFEIQISRDELEKLIAELRTTIGADADSLFKASVRKNSMEIYNRFLQLSALLYSYLIEPIKNSIEPAEVLYIIPDDILYYLPFAALISNHKNNKRFLVQDYALAYAPSAAVLNHCLKRKKSKIPPKQMKILIVGDPIKNLPAAEKEARKISNLYVHSKLLIGDEISEKIVVNSLSEGFNIIHFATHAIINENSPLFSHLVLEGQPDSAKESAENDSSTDTKNYDGLLMTHEVFNLNLSNVSLVNLSACKTAGGRLFRGEGVVGMTRAFVKAGASSMITSLWKIDDNYTEKIMTAFYEQWNNNGISKAHSLKEAQNKVIREMASDNQIKYPHPYAWAAFILTGDYH